MSSIVPLSPIQPHGIRRRSSYPHRRLSNASYNTALISRPSNTFEQVFTNVMECFLFTSAIAITAYGYWMGDIVHRPRLASSPFACHGKLDLLQSESPSVPPLSPEPNDTVLDLKQIDPAQSVSSKTEFGNAQHTDLNEKVSDVLDERVPDDLDERVPDELEDEDSDEQEDDDDGRVDRMEETLQELIRQGQAALSATY